MMLLRDLLCELDAPEVGAAVVSVSGTLTRPVTGVHHDSRDVGDQGLFIALAGEKTDGRSYVGGLAHASAVLTGAPVDVPEGVTVVVVDHPRIAMAHLAAAFHGHPAASIPTIGVTGTNGKTTTCALLEAALTHCGDTVGVVGTTGNRLAGEAFAPSKARTSGHTTPESPYLQALMERMRDEGASVFCMEASSIGLAARRVDAIPFDVGVFTNLSRDHLDYHGDMATYLTAKARLFHELLAPDGTAVLPIDSASATALIPADRRLLMTGIGAGDVRATQVMADDKGTTSLIETPVGSAQLRLPLVGEHNLRNALSAIAATVAIGRSLDEAVVGLGRLKGVSGRLEAVENTLGILVLVDYAHTPHALERVLASLRRIAQGRILTVFGCGGDRDRGKRPDMGAAASAGSDLVFVTSDNPRSESPAAIVQEILSGVAGPHVVESDRSAAIHQAIAEAQPGDIVLIAGKGHETYQEIAGLRIEFDDRLVARAALQARS
jgi:UDP-N-acetylmuramyl-tripeptide synthetase